MGETRDGRAPSCGEMLPPCLTILATGSVIEGRSCASRAASSIMDDTVADFSGQASAKGYLTIPRLSRKITRG